VATPLEASYSGSTLHARVIFLVSTLGWGCVFTDVSQTCAVIPSSHRDKSIYVFLTFHFTLPHIFPFVKDGIYPMINKIRKFSSSLRSVVTIMRSFFYYFIIPVYFPQWSLPCPVVSSLQKPALSEGFLYSSSTFSTAGGVFALLVVPLIRGS